MAHRLIASMRSVEWILKNGLYTGNCNNFAQVQPRYSDLRRFLSQSSVYFSLEQLKTFDKSLRPHRGNNVGAGAKTEGTEMTSVDNRITNASSTSPPKSTTKAPDQGYKSGGNGAGGGNRKTNIRKNFIDEMDERRRDNKVCYFLCIPIMICMPVYKGWHIWKNCFNEITWKEFCDYLCKGKVAKIEVKKKKFLRGVFEFIMVLRLIIDILALYKNKGPVTITLEITVGREDEAPAVHKKKARN